MRALLLLVFLVSTTLGHAQSTAVDASWSAFQAWGPAGPRSGVEASLEAALPWVPLLGVGASGGLELASTPQGALRFAQPFVGGRVALRFAGNPGFRPWIGWLWGPNSTRLEGGLEASFSLWGPYALVVGGRYGVQDWTLSIGTRTELSTTPEAPRPVLSGRTSPFEFSPDGDGVDDVLRIGYRLVSGGPSQRWSWTIFTPEGQTLAQGNGEGPLPPVVLWDGGVGSGVRPTSYSEYRFVLRVDTSAGSTTAESSVRTGLVIEQSGNTSTVRLAALPRTDDVARLVAALRRQGARTLTVSAHTKPVNRTDTVLALEEDRTVSAPLTLQRALELRQALVDAGWDAAALRTEGFGSRRPLVPFEDPGAWRNRRLEITWESAPR